MSLALPIFSILSFNQWENNNVASIIIELNWIVSFYYNIHHISIKCVYVISNYDSRAESNKILASNLWIILYE